MNILFNLPGDKKVPVEPNVSATTKPLMTGMSSVSEGLLSFNTESTSHMSFFIFSFLNPQMFMNHFKMKHTKCSLKGSECTCACVCTSADNNKKMLEKGETSIGSCTTRRLPLSPDLQSSFITTEPKALSQ